MLNKKFVTLTCLASLILAFPSVCSAQEEIQLYPNPGIVTFREGKWVGSDHLYNLSSNIDIFVEIFKPEKIEVPFTRDELRSIIAEVFKKYKIEPFASPKPGEPALPFLHLLVMLYPIEKKGFAIYTEGRLFENIDLNRIKLDENTFLQGITWESSNLVVAQSDDLQKQVAKGVEEIATTFGERYKFYSNIKSQLQQNK